MLPLDVLEALKRISDRSKETAARLAQIEAGVVRGPQGPQGPQGDPGENAPAPTPEQIESAVSKWVESNIERITGPKGDDGRDGADAKPVDYEAINRWLVDLTKASADAEIEEVKSILASADGKAKKV